MPGPQYDALKDFKEPEDTLLLCQHVVLNGATDWEVVGTQLGCPAALCELRWHVLWLQQYTTTMPIKPPKGYSDWELAVLLLAGQYSKKTRSLKCTTFEALAKWLPGRTVTGLKQAYGAHVSGAEAALTAKLQSYGWPDELTALLTAWPGPQPGHKSRLHLRVQAVATEVVRAVEASWEQQPQSKKVAQQQHPGTKRRSTFDWTAAKKAPAPAAVPPSSQIVAGSGGSFTDSSSDRPAKHRVTAFNTPSLCAVNAADSRAQPLQASSCTLSVPYTAPQGFGPQGCLVPQGLGPLQVLSPQAQPWQISPQLLAMQLPAVQSVSAGSAAHSGSTSTSPSPAAICSMTPQLPPAAGAAAGAAAGVVPVRTWAGPAAADASAAAAGFGAASAISAGAAAGAAVSCQQDALMFDDLLDESEFDQIFREALEEVLLQPPNTLQPTSNTTGSDMACNINQTAMLYNAAQLPASAPLPPLGQQQQQHAMLPLGGVSDGRSSCTAALGTAVGQQQQQQQGGSSMCQGQSCVSSRQVSTVPLPLRGYMLPLSYDSSNSSGSNAAAACGSNPQLHLQLQQQQALQGPSCTTPEGRTMSRQVYQQLPQGLTMQHQNQPQHTPQWLPGVQVEPQAAPIPAQMLQQQQGQGDQGMMANLVATLQQRIQTLEQQQGMMQGYITNVFHP